MTDQDRIVVERTWRKSGANMYDQNRIKKLQEEGLSVVEIAVECDIDPNAVRNWCEHFEAGGATGYNTKFAVEEVEEEEAPKPKKKAAKKKAKKKPAAKKKAEEDWDE